MEGKGEETWWIDGHLMSREKWLVMKAIFGSGMGIERITRKQSMEDEYNTCPQACSRTMHA